MSNARNAPSLSSDEEGNFNISLAEWDTPYTIPKLLRYAMKTLREEYSSKPYIHELSLLDADHPYEGRATISVSYWDRDKDTEVFEQERLGYRKELRVAPPTEEIRIFPAKNTAASFRMLEYRVPQNDTQGDTILLIESLADYLEENKIDTILDLIFHDYLDSDALNHPFVRVYYRDK